VCAVVAAPVVATIAVGAVVGAGIAVGTAAASTYIQDGKVDWEAVGICAGVGVIIKITLFEVKKENICSNDYLLNY